MDLGLMNEVDKSFLTQLQSPLTANEKISPIRIKRFRKSKKIDKFEDVDHISKFVNKILLKTNDEFLKHKLRAH